MLHEIAVFQPIGWHGILVIRNPRGIWYKSAQAHPEAFTDGMRHIVSYTQQAFTREQWIPMDEFEMRYSIPRCDGQVVRHKSAFVQKGIFYNPDCDVPTRFGIRPSDDGDD